MQKQSINSFKPLTIFLKKFWQAMTSYFLSENILRCLQLQKNLHGRNSEKCGTNETRWNEHYMPSEKWNPSKHLHNNITHHFNRSVIGNAPVKKLPRKILEVYFIALLKPIFKQTISIGQLFAILQLRS